MKVNLLTKLGNSLLPLSSKIYYASQDEVAKP